MTTIAYKDGVLACDSMETHSSEAGGSRAFYHCQKIIEVDDGFIASSGDSDGLSVWLDYHELLEKADTETQKFKLEIMSEFDFDVFWMASDGNWTSNNTGILTQCFEPFYALGSGSKAAMAAMICGKSAEAAVEVAMSVDPYTGGAIQAYRL